MRRRQKLTRGREVHIFASVQANFADAPPNMAVRRLRFNDEQVRSDVAPRIFAAQPQRGDDGQDNMAVELEKSKEAQPNCHDVQPICANEQDICANREERSATQQESCADGQEISAIQPVIFVNGQERHAPQQAKGLEALWLILRQAMNAVEREAIEAEIGGGEGVKAEAI